MMLRLNAEEKQWEGKCGHAFEDNTAMLDKPDRLNWPDDTDDEKGIEAE